MNSRNISVLAAVAAALLAIQLWLGFAFIRSAAPTYDEAVHLASGYSYLKTGVYRLNVMDHPPLAEMWAALALLPVQPHVFVQHPDWIYARVYHYADMFLYKNTLPAETLLNRARRFDLVTWTLLLAVALAWWAWRAAGPAAAAGALCAQAFCPALLSNFALVTTDGASTALFFAACAAAAEAARREEERGRGSWLWALAGVCAGLALAAKFNMIVLPPLLFALGLLGPLLSAPRRAPPSGLWWMLGAAALALALPYRFLHAGLWWEGLRATLSRLDEGRRSFFFGHVSVVGRWDYFPLALAVKTPLPLLLLAAAGLTRAARLPWRRGMWVWAPPAVYMALALTAKVQIGYRHVLPVVPFLLLWSALACAWLWEKKIAGRAVLAALGAWLVVGVARVHPDQLAYFNESVGGPDRGYECLVDSNLDWGQALKPLAAELKRIGNPPVYLSYFGTADPADYGIRYLPVGVVANVERPGNDPDPAASGRVLLAISATNLQGTYYPDSAAFAWLKARKPLAVSGRSIFLYDLTADEDGRRRLAALVPPEAARRLLGRG
ncbi:MAG: hypothetical protein NTX64_18655 [Elusimicrobia bacterium]|nr:hypothetical protein [Elusimicrobiota bacterium]